MPQLTTKTSWLAVLVALLGVSTVYARPIHQTENGQAGNLAPRSPRLIPDTRKYLDSLFQDLGLSDPAPTPTAAPTPTSPASPASTPNVQPEQAQPESLKASSTTHMIYSSSTSYTPTYDSNGAGYTQTVKHETNQKPVANIQLGQGWGNGRKLTSEDLPIVFDAMNRELRHQLSDMIDSSDEIGLDGFMQ